MRAVTFGGPAETRPNPALTAVTNAVEALQVFGEDALSRFCQARGRSRDKQPGGNGPVQATCSVSGGCVGLEGL